MTGRHRSKATPLPVTVWLGAGAITLGVGAALTSGAGVASASTDESSGTSASAGTHQKVDSDTSTKSADTAPGPKGISTSPAPTPAGDTTSTPKVASTSKATPAPKKKPRRGTDRQATSAATSASPETDSSDDGDAVTIPKRAVVAGSAPRTVQTTDSRVSAAPKVAALPAARATAAPATATDPLTTLANHFQRALATYQKKYLNKRPTITVAEPTHNADGTWTGQVSASDPDGDPLAISVPLQVNSAGLNTLNADGSFTFTPAAYALSTPGYVASLFFETVETNCDSHFHGFGQLRASLFADSPPVVLALFGLRPYASKEWGTAKLRVDIPVGPTTTSTLATAKAESLPTAATNPLNSFVHGIQAWITKTFNNTAPTITISTPTKNTDGTYTGQFTASDVDGDPLTIEYTASMIYGTTSVADHGDGTYTYTYTPSEAALTEPNLTYHLSFTAVETNAAAHFHGPAQIRELIVDATLGNLLRAVIADPFNELPRYSPFDRARGRASVPVAVGPVVPVT